MVVACLGFPLPAGSTRQPWLSFRTMSTTDKSGWPGLEQPDTSNATYIDWKNISKSDEYDPDETWQDERYPRRYADFHQSLDGYNNGWKNGYWWNKEYYAWLENDRVIATISGQLELTRRERAKAKGLFHKIPLHKMGRHKEEVAVALCLYVIEQDEKDRRRGHPNCLAWWQYRLIESHFGISERMFRKRYGKIEHRVRTGDPQETRVFDKYRSENIFSPDSDPIEYEHMVEATVVEQFG